MAEEKMSPREWVDMNAEANANAQAERQREILKEFAAAIDKAQNPPRDVENEIRHWRKVFAASSIEAGKNCDEALSIADEMIGKIYGA